MIVDLTAFDYIIGRYLPETAKQMKFFSATIAIIFLLYFIAAFGLYLMQRKFIYYPSPVVSHSYVTEVIVVDDKIRLNLIAGNAGSSEAVIYFGGNAESVASAAPDLIATLPDKAVYLVNYRGYGGSDGMPTELHLFKDAEIIFDFVSARHARVSVIGRSLGSGVACWLATQRPVDGMVLITPYDSILNLARKAYPVFPVGWLLKDQYRSIDYAPDIKTSVSVILAGRDSVIPAASSNRLIQAFSGEVNVSVLENSDHNNLQMDEEFYLLIQQYLL